MKTVSLLVCAILSSVFAFPNFVDSLSKKELRKLDSVVTTYKTLDGKSLSEVKDEPLIGSRLYNFAAWYCKVDRDVEYILDKVLKREQNFYPPASDSFAVAASSTTPAGDSTSPYEIVAYITSTCPHCKQIGIPLYDMVTKGELVGKATFVIKPIHKKIGDFALLSADRMGKMWDLFIALGDIKKYLDEEELLLAAEKAGINIGALTNDIEKRVDENEKQISENYEECKVNGLEFTPTLYINGVRYRSNKHPLWIQDYIEYLLEVKK